MTASSIPTVDEKNPTDQNSFRQYTFLTQGKRWRNPFSPRLLKKVQMQGGARWAE
jgi:hypothetical protein